MGAWGVGGFANDMAGDWSWEFENADLETGLKLITDALSFKLSDHIIHEGAAETVAVAAAEMVAAINGHPMDYEGGFNDDAMEWIARAHPASDPDLTNLARQAVLRVTGPDSHIASGWVDDAEPEWRAFMAELAAKLADLSRSLANTGPGMTVILAAASENQSTALTAEFMFGCRAKPSSGPGHRATAGSASRWVAHPC